MGKGKKENEVISLKKRLINLEEKYGFNYNSETTPEVIQQQDSPVYQKKNNFNNEQTNSNPEKSVSIEIESIKNTIDNKVSEIRGEIREESNYVRGRFDTIAEMIRTEGIDLRTMFVSRSLFFWLIGILISILGAVGYFAYSNLDNDVKEIKQDVKGIRKNLDEGPNLKNKGSQNETEN
ncbi:hypothetical protein GCM10027284_09570 [Cyclobacterium sediminis]